jgi:hypothetical protein
MTQQPLPALETFELSFVSVGNQQVIHRLLCYYAQHRRLTRLLLHSVGHEAQPETLREIASRAGGGGHGSAASVPFSRLRILSLAADCDAVPLLARLVPSITELELTVEEACGVFGALATLTQLTGLWLELGSRDPVVQRVDILSLRNNKNMKEFSFRTSYQRRLEVSDADIVQLISSWRSLERFTLDVSMSNSPKLIGLIGTACPSLVKLNLIWFDLFLH